MSSDHAPFALRLFRYKANPIVFGQGGRGSWKEAWLALYDNDTLVWYNDKHCSKVRGQIRNFSSTAMPSVKIGRVAEKEAEHLHPRRPGWAAADEALYLAVPKVNGKKSDWHWFYAKKDSDLLSCLLSFAKSAGREGHFRLLIEEKRMAASPQPFVTKYKKFGASLKGDSVKGGSTVLAEDIGVIWKKFVDSLPAANSVEEPAAHVNHGFMETESRIDTEVPEESLKNPRIPEVTTKLEPLDDSDLQDVGYFSSRADTMESGRESTKGERTDSDVSDATTYFSTTASIEIHPKCHLDIEES